jgi:hypothetical protein
MQAGCLRLGLLIFLVLFTTKLIAAQSPSFSLTASKDSIVSRAGLAPAPMATDASMLSK